MTDKQMIEKIEEIIAPYQTEIELDCLSLPIAIESILERKEQECERLERIVAHCCHDILYKDSLQGQLNQLKAELEQYEKSKQASIEALQKRFNELELGNRKLKAENEELKKKLNCINIK